MVGAHTIILGHFAFGSFSGIERIIALAEEENWGILLQKRTFVDYRVRGLLLTEFKEGAMAYLPSGEMAPMVLLMQIAFFGEIELEMKVSSAPDMALHSEIESPHKPVSARFDLKVNAVDDKITKTRYSCTSLRLLASAHA